MNTFLKHLKKPFSVKKLLHKNIARTQPGRSHKVLHASDLTKDVEFCPRHFALLDLEDRQPDKEFIPTALGVTFDTGRFMEHQIRNVWLRNYVGGYWRRTDAPTVVTGFGACPKVDSDRWEYVEPRFRVENVGVSCGVDFLVRMPSGKYRPVESKIMDKDQHRDLVAPLAEHKLRTQLYLWMIENSSNPARERVDTSKATILYVSRSYGFKDDEVDGYGVPDSPYSPFKEFEVVRDDDRLFPYIEKANDLALFRREGVIPDGICSTPLEARAKKCSTCKVCFSGQYKPGSLIDLETLT